MTASARAILEDFPLASMADGDVYIVNDSYRGGVHANDVMVCRPVFLDGTVRFLAASLIHVLDLGGSAHGGINAQAQETLEEGLQIPPLLYQRDGVVNDTLIRLIRLNSRSPDATVADIEALVAGTVVTSLRVGRLADRYPPDRLDRFVETHLRTTEERVRAGIGELPDGIYRGSSCIDDDGLTGRDYRIEVCVRVKGDEVELDFEGTSDQVRAVDQFECVAGVRRRGVRCPVLPRSDHPDERGFPTGDPVHLPPGVAPQSRSSASVRGEDDGGVRRGGRHHRRRPAPVAPDKAIAGSGILAGFTIAGIGTRSSYWLHNAFELEDQVPASGRMGSTLTGIHFGVGRSQLPQVEPVEARCRLLVEEIALIADSGGAGRWRGGLGVRTSFRALDDALVSVRTDHFRTPPAGRDGGEAGRPGGFWISGRDGQIRALPSKQSNVPLSKGELFVVETAGGGGLGQVGDRPGDAVAADIRSGRVTEAGAVESYHYPGAPAAR